jgi:ATP-dependent DNA helicase RecG
LANNDREITEQLASLGFYDLDSNCPTNAGILLFGLSPRLFLKGAYLQYVKFDSEEMDKEHVVTEKEFSGAMITELKNIDDFIRTNIIKSRPVRNDSFQEKQISNFPIWALRELTMNALMHRDYESNAPVYLYEFNDRIEIQNPGGLYGDVNRENFPNASDYRNPLLAASFKVLGYVNRFNYGIKNAQRALKDNGNPPAEFVLNLITKFHVTIRISEHWR